MEKKVKVVEIKKPHPNSPDPSEHPELFGWSGPATGTGRRFGECFTGKGSRDCRSLREYFFQLFHSSGRLDVAQKLAQGMSPGEIVTRDDLHMLVDQLQNPGSELYLKAVELIMHITWCYKWQDRGGP